MTIRAGAEANYGTGTANRVGAGGLVSERTHVWDLIGVGVLGADGGDACVRGLAGFGESVVA